MTENQSRKVSIILWIIFLGAVIFKCANLAAGTISDAVDILMFVYLQGIAYLILGLYKEIAELKKK
jgi:hypothetical protein